jgi:two-component system, cell cycle response regulator
MSETTGRRVLVIGEYMEPELMKHILSRCNDTVEFASTPLQGLTMAEQDPPDLIITYLLMPELSGYEVCQRLKITPLLRNIPVLIIGGRQEKDVYPEAQRVGSAGYLCAPFGVQDLLAARDAALNGETYSPPLADS